MTPHEFITRWQNTSRKERSAAQAHFIDLCQMLDEPTPAEADSDGRDYDFEFGATKTTGGRGFADVFKRGHFGWEYKGTHGNLDVAFAQLQRYAVALDNPPLLIVSDIGTTIRIHTNWTNSVSKTYEIPIADLGDADKRGWLKAAFTDPEALRPAKTRQQLTEEVAGDFAALARSLRDRGNDPEEVAHFINRLVFCMFAEDVKLLHDRMFTRMLERALEDPGEFEDFARDLFRAMSKGGRIGFEKVPHFNGGLFDNDRVFALSRDEIRLVHRAAAHYWGDIDPSILGTLFERGLDPDKRSQLGAHYTDRDKIMMIIDPVIVEPLAAEWAAAKDEIVALLDRALGHEADAKTKAGRTASAALGRATVARQEAQGVLERHLKRLADFRVLDPACGSGNFLYLALRALKDLEHRAQVEAEALGLPRRFPSIGPEVVKGIEINPYAAELARVSVWIGEIQWMLKNGFPAAQNPVLKPLETIECRDALVTLKASPEAPEAVWHEAVWPQADAIIGNPPFLGGKVMRMGLGDEVVERLFHLYRRRVPAEADLVVYWIAKAADAIEAGRTARAGLVTTNSVRGGSNRVVMDRVADKIGFVSAWSDEPWTVEGAAVRVSLLAFGAQRDGEVAHLNGLPVVRINPDLTATAFDLTKALRLFSNRGTAVIGRQKDGPLDVPGETGRRLLAMTGNPHGQPNSLIVRPWRNGMDIVRRPQDKFLIDFMGLPYEEAMLFEAPFEYAREHLKPLREENRDRQRRENWWRPGRSGEDVREALGSCERFIGTPRISKHRIFVWLHKAINPDCQVVAVARDDDVTFGILHSRFHELWSLRMGTWLGVGNDPRYTPTTTFETFPFPQGLTPDTPAADYAGDPRAVAIAAAAARLNELRENWLNPAELVRREPEVVAGYPDRILPVDAEAAKALAKRTLTKLYNERPAWLDHAHRALDATVATAYGWPADLPDDEILARLFALNQERATAQTIKRPVVLSSRSAAADVAVVR